MRIGRGVAWLELELAGYQFPAAPISTGPGGQNWDANWLIIEGRASRMGGNSWSFRDPSLTTWDVLELIGWLRDVSQGRVPQRSAAAFVDAGDADPGNPTRWLTFDEPNLSFGVRDVGGSPLLLLVVLSHESAALPRDPMHPTRSEVTVVVTPHQVEEAAVSLEAQLAAYPVR